MLFLGAACSCCSFCCPLLGEGLRPTLAQTSTSVPAASSGGWYDKVIAYSMQHSMEGYEDVIRPLKVHLFSHLLDELSQEAIGTGPRAATRKVLP
jgi:hypothetical protein